MARIVHNARTRRHATPDEAAMVVEWLEAAMKSAGLKKRKDLAKIAGITEDQMSKVFRGIRRLSSAELLRISDATGVPAINAADAAMHPIAKEGARIPKAHTSKGAPEITYVTVRGEVAAGTWREVIYDDFDEYETPYAHDTRWPSGSVYGLVIRGESVNRLARDGDIAIVLRLDAAPRSFREDDMVVVERNRDGLVETTLKRVRRQNGNGWELWPESDDPAHQSPIPLSDGDHDTIRVIGFVLDFVKPITRFGGR